MSGGASFSRTPVRRIDIWSDVACPFCYLGTTALEKAIADSPELGPIQVVHHSYELVPGLSGRFPGSIDEFLAEEQGVPVSQARAINRSLSQRAAAAGLAYRPDVMVVAGTRAAHRLIHFAKERGRQHEMVHRLFRAQFSDGLDVSDVSTLAGLAADIGLDRDEAHTALIAGAHEEDVATDIAEARRLGVQGVPFFVFDGVQALSGALSADGFRQALRTVWAAA